MLHKHHRTDGNDSEIVEVLRKLGAEVVEREGELDHGLEA